MIYSRRYNTKRSTPKPQPNRPAVKRERSKRRLSMRSKGGGWYQISDGTRVQGREKAQQYIKRHE